MGGITFGYLVRRLSIFFVTIWVAASLIWLIPRLAPGDPVSAMVSRMIRNAGYVENSERIIEGTGSPGDRKSTRLNSSYVKISYAVFCLTKKTTAHRAHAESQMPAYR